MRMYGLFDELPELLELGFYVDGTWYMRYERWGDTVRRYTTEFGSVTHARLHRDGRVYEEKRIEDIPQAMKYLAHRGE